MYFRTKYRPADILLNVSAVIGFKFKVLWKFINNRNYSSVIVNFCRGLLLKECNLKFRKSEFYHEKKTATSVSRLTHLSSAYLTSIHSGFRNPFFLDPLYSNVFITLFLFFFFQTIFVVEFTRLNSRHNSAFFFFPFFICRITLTFTSTLKTFLLFVIVAMLWLYQTTVNCSSRNVEGNWTHKVNSRYYFHFPNLGALSRTRRELNSQKILLLGKLHLKRWLTMPLYRGWLIWCMSY